MQLAVLPAGLMDRCVWMCGCVIAAGKVETGVGCCARGDVESVQG